METQAHATGKSQRLKKRNQSNFWGDAIISQTDWDSTFDSKLTFEKQVRTIAATASMRVGILRKTMSVFRDVSIVAKCFWAFLLPVLEYCSPVWMSAATSHLSLLDRVVSQVSRLSGGSVSCDLWHRRKVAYLSAFFKIDSLVDHPVRVFFSSAVCVEETNPWSFCCSLSIFRDA